MGNPYRDESLLKTRAGRARDPAEGLRCATKVCAQAGAGDAAAFRRGLYPMKTQLSSLSMLEVAKVFAINGALCFRRLSDNTFIIPLYKTQANFTINVNEAHSLVLTPLTLTFKCAQPLLSVRDLLRADTFLEKAFFRCYYDPAFVLDKDRFNTSIGLSYHGKRYDLNCKVYIPKYEKFYASLVPNATRKHVTVRVENVQLPAVQKYKSP